MSKAMGKCAKTLQTISWSMESKAMLTRPTGKPRALIESVAKRKLYTVASLRCLHERFQLKVVSLFAPAQSLQGFARHDART